MSVKRAYTCSLRVWRHPGMAGWHFVTLPKKESDRIRKEFGAQARGWRSIRVEARVGTSAWKTSIFPDSRAGAYLLPLKAAIRKKERIAEGEPIRLALTINQ